jgi:putative nucleotidyltransferase-like protein
MGLGTFAAMPTVAKPMEAMLAALKASAAALRDSDIPFAVSGGFAAWARGGPASDHDVDLVIRADDADAALAAMQAAGMRTERPPEGWLVKAWHDDVLVDLIHSPAGYEVDDDILGAAEVLTVDGMDMPVLPVTDVLVSKLCALNERHLDFEGLLQITRALREQIDWPRVRRRTSDSPFARAFLALASELGIVTG